ncbi:MAG: hypothetical protein RMY34_31795 [Aulosira sp. DedQUE10]|nr:hypothetical protein [Aulosira sp. DedQUE10]
MPNAQQLLTNYSLMLQSNRIDPWNQSKIRHEKFATEENQHHLL